MAVLNFPVSQSSSPDALINNEQVGTDGGTGKPIISQIVRVTEHTENPVDPTGGLTRYSPSSSATALDPPTAAANYCRVRVWESTGSGTKRLYYRSDGTAPTANGNNAFGYLIHGDVILVKIPDKSNWKMIGETGAAFEVYAEWFN